MATAELRDDGYIVVVMNMREADELTDAVEEYATQIFPPDDAAPSVYRALVELANENPDSPAVMAGLKVCGYQVAFEDDELEMFAKLNQAAVHEIEQESYESRKSAERDVTCYEGQSADPGSELD